MTKQQSENIKNSLLKQLPVWLSVTAIIFSGFLYITKPTQKNDTALQLQHQQIQQQQDIIDKITKIQQNDTQEVKSELKEVRREQGELKEEVIKLQTILEERLPAEH
jgi:septal ring factor EnvC (AmiA/AmiB activator)